VKIIFQIYFLSFRLPTSPRCPCATSRFKVNEINFILFISIFRFICHLCQKVFENKRKLTKHKSSSHRDKSYQCDQCGFQTKTKSSLRVHTLRHTESRPFQCDHPGCLSRFKDKEHLNSHKRSHNDSLYECYLCAKRFKSYIHIKSHLAQHFDALKKYSCEICSKVYSTKYLLDVHLAGHMGKRMFTCKLCPNSYMRQSALNVHKKSAHLKIRYQCKFCDKLFGQDKSLVEHLFSHRGDKPVSLNYFSLIRKIVFKVRISIFFSGTVLFVVRVI
jgi:KRAB domain-containing zinc finger protein